MVLYFKGKCTHFSPTLHLLMTCKTQVLKGTTQGRYRIFKKILTPSKITLPLHRFIKKFFKTFQAHKNYIATPPPPQKKILKINHKWTSKRIVPQRRLVTNQRKVRDDLHDSAVQWTAGTFIIALSPPLLS